MRVLATGGAGYVGSASVRHLLSQGVAVVVYDNLTTGHGGSVPADCLVRGDLAEGESQLLARGVRVSGPAAYIGGKALCRSPPDTATRPRSHRQPDPHAHAPV